jgi:hypothetical protein
LAEEAEAVMSLWEKTFEEQMGLWNFWRSRHGQVFGQGWMDNYTAGEKQIPLAEVYPGIAQVGLADFETERLYKAEPIYVAEEMQDLLDQAIPGFEPEPLLPSDLVTPNGFVIFPRPFYVDDIRWRKISWRAALWSSYTLYFPGTEPTPGILISMYSLYDDPDDAKYPPEAKNFFIHTRLSLLHLAPWTFGTEIPADDRVRQPLRQLQCFFRLTMQHITTHDKFPLSRPTKRRAKRYKMKEKNVTVIRLRRPKSKAEHEGEPMQHDHRWVVRGHWRNQWFPSLDIHRQIYIHEYIKGPEDKPLRITERRAFELVQ